MAPSDLEQLLEMGFEKARAELAVKKGGGRKAPLSPPPPRMTLPTDIEPDPEDDVPGVSLSIWWRTANMTAAQCKEPWTGWRRRRTPR